MFKGNNTANLEFSYIKTASLEFYNDIANLYNVPISDLGYTYIVNYTNGSIAFSDEDGMLSLYTVQGFQIHSPSEHTFDEETYDLEI